MNREYSVHEEEFMTAGLALQTKPNTLQAREEIVARVIRVMRSRLAEPLSLQDMADIAYLSPFHFNRIFHHTTGITPTQFLYAIRLEEAKRLLLTTTLNVTDVCYEVGYSSLGTFIFRFTQLVGMSPNRFRALAGSMSMSAFEKALTALHPDSQQSSSFVTGRVNCPVSFSGVIFVGLFDTRIPQKRPVAGAVMTQTGGYQVGMCPDGSYHVLAAGLHLSRDPLTYWLPDPSSLLVGSGHQLLLVQNDKPLRAVNVTLRPMTILDPPILVALPALLAGESHGETADLS